MDPYIKFGKLDINLNCLELRHGRTDEQTVDIEAHPDFPHLNKHSCIPRVKSIRNYLQEAGDSVKSSEQAFGSLLKEKGRLKTLVAARVVPAPDACF